MTDPRIEIKQFAAKEEASLLSKIKGNKGWLIAVVVAFLFGLILPHVV